MYVVRIEFKSDYLSFVWNKLFCFSFSVWFPSGIKEQNKVNFALEQAMKAQKGNRGIQLYCFFNLGARYRWVVSVTLRSL
jgi:hypothetical protein